MSSGSVLLTEERNPRGIPKAPFIVSFVGQARWTLTDQYHRQADVEQYLGGPEGEVEIPLRNFQDAIAYVTHVSYCVVS